ncbi:Serine/threonine-protein kinase SSN3 [Scheffersomyces amazonensis]|uniref:Serine/threonine-protein kinase SSN3 n=1 Tax=Scheffersomyces amazonensis TaxID=1078765 RepID=UPI00315D23E6
MNSNGIINSSNYKSLSMNLPSNQATSQQMPSNIQQQIQLMNGVNNISNSQMPVIPQPALMASNSILTLGPFKHRKDLTRESVLSTYQIIGYIAAGTYGKVYKARLKNTNKESNQTNPNDGINDLRVNDENVKSRTITRQGTPIVQVNTDSTPSTQLFAIKKFKSDNHSSNKAHHNHDMGGNEIIHYTGISQSAIREMSLCRELNNKNIIKLIDIILENKSIYIIFEFCEHDLLQIIHYHSHPEVKRIPQATIKSLIWQILNGVTYLHQNWIFHRDLKPANIMVSSSGVVKIGDLGLARKFNNPLQSLYTGDKVVVTIWYRAPELLLGARHYTPAIDLWAVGCILAELLSLRPIFKGEEAKIDINNKKSVPFQKNQFQKIIEVLGTPNLKAWPSLNKYPDFPSFQQQITTNYNSNIDQWYKLIGGTNKLCLTLLKGLLEYDPQVRLTADNALVHDYFLELPKVQENAFDGLNLKYPKRRIYTDDNDIISNQQQVHQMQQSQQQQQSQVQQSQQQQQQSQSQQSQQQQQQQSHQSQSQAVQTLQQTQIQPDMASYKRQMDGSAGNAARKRAR